MSDREAYASLIDHIRDCIFDLPESELLLPILKMRLSSSRIEGATQARYSSHPWCQAMARTAWIYNGSGTEMPYRRRC